MTGTLKGARRFAHFLSPQQNKGKCQVGERVVRGESDQSAGNFFGAPHISDIGGSDKHAPHQIVIPCRSWEAAEQSGFLTPPLPLQFVRQHIKLVACRHLPHGASSTQISVVLGNLFLWSVTLLPLKRLTFFLPFKKSSTGASTVILLFGWR